MKAREMIINSRNITPVVCLSEDFNSQIVIFDMSHLCILEEEDCTPVLPVVPVGVFPDAAGHAYLNVPSAPKMI
jgi:hypothetical protein